MAEKQTAAGEETPGRLPYTARLRPCGMLKTRTFTSGAVSVLFVAWFFTRPEPESTLYGLLAALVLGLAVAWEYSRSHINLRITKDGITPYQGGFLPRAAIPAADFRSVHLRTLSHERVRPVIRRYGVRPNATALAAEPSELRAVPGSKLRTTGKAMDDATLYVTKPGTLVEVIGHSGRIYLFSPENPEEMAAALVEVIRANR
ncbi:hypothetical protein ACUH90_03815 [Dermabacteraceae bacterium P7054]